MPVEVQLAYVMEFKPGLKNLAILVDSKNISAVQTQAEPIAARARKQGIQVFMGTVQNPAKANEELAQIIPDAVRTMQKNDFDLSKSAFLITGSTTVFREIKIINEKAGRVPVISMIPEIVTAGRDTALLAVGISFESNAHLAAIYGTDILRGRAKPGQLKVGIVSPPDIAVSFLKAREIGMRVPFSLFETATFVYDYDGQLARPLSRKVN
jgi:putative ABC transport system substrate-binding protein